MNIEAKLLSRVINERDLTPLLTAGANDGWFIDRSNKQVWTLMREHFLKYQELTRKDNYGFSTFPLDLQISPF